MKPCIPILAGTVLLASVAYADPPAATLSPSWRFSEQTPEALYANVCQACHMADAKGAVGAGTIPALAANPRLAGAASCS